MEFSTAAIASIVALAIVVAISCVNEDLNVGFLSIGFAIIVAGLFGNITGASTALSITTPQHQANPPFQTFPLEESIFSPLCGIDL